MGFDLFLNLNFSAVSHYLVTLNNAGHFKMLLQRKPEMYLSGPPSNARVFGEFIIRLPGIECFRYFFAVANIFKACSIVKKNFLKSLHDEWKGKVLARMASLRIVMLQIILSTAYILLVSSRQVGIVVLLC